MWGFEMITDFQGKKDKRSNSKHSRTFRNTTTNWLGNFKKKFSVFFSDFYFIGTNLLSNYTMTTVKNILATDFSFAENKKSSYNFAFH